MNSIFKKLQNLAIAMILSLLTGISAYAQQALSVRGRVTDGSGPVPGVFVIVPGTSNGTTTDRNGEYLIGSVPPDGVLQFSLMGYDTEEVKVNSRTVINVTMHENTEELEELVVIGYGTVKKSDLTGSVASVSEEDMRKAATSDPIQALQGRAAGVSIVSATGSPDATAEIKIRGTGTTNDTNPLFVVDGFPMSSIEYLSPNDIASIEILKDASACAIYGSRGANGVVMVTTKQGQAGALKVRVSAEYGIETVPRKPDMLSSVQYAEMVGLAYRNSGLAVPDQYSNPSSMAVDTDWFSEVMHPGTYQNYSASLNGGNDKVNTNFSVNWFDREGTVKSTGFTRLNIQDNTTFKPFKFLTLRASLSAAFSRTRSIASNGTSNNSIFLSSLIAPPDVPVWDDFTNYYSGITAFRLANPAGVIARNADSGSTSRTFLIGNFSADVQILPELTFSSRFGYKYTIGLTDSFSPIYYETSNIASNNNSVGRSTAWSSDWTWENILTWSRKFGKNHELTVMAAMSARDYYTESYSASRMDLPSEDPAFRYLDAATNNIPSVSGNASALGMLSYLGRINYSLMNRYLFTVSYRADGSSRFVGAKKWGYFPSGAFAWKLSEEPFFKNAGQEVVSSAKVRLGWGQIGNERVNSYYPYLTSISQQQYYILGDTPTRYNGSAPSTLGNIDVQWETSEQYNAGIDLEFFRNRLSATVDVFLRKTDNILLSESVPRISGASSIIRNVGGMENRGVELTLGWKDDVGDFSYSIDGNISFIRNEVTNLGSAGILQSNFGYDWALIDFQGQFSYPIRSEPGHPYGQFYGYEFLGIFQNQSQIDNYKSSDGTVIMPNAKPGDSIFADINDDGKINSSDMTYIGNPNPKATYGLSFNASWKNFDISMLWQGVWGVDVFNASKFYFQKFDGRQNVLASSYMAGWDGEGSTNSMPITLAYASDDARNSQNWWQSTMYIEDGSYLRLKTFQLGYSLRPKFAGGTQASFRIYLSAQNLITLTRYSGLDPEIPDNGIDRGQYPQPRTFIIGLNINL